MGHAEAPGAGRGMPLVFAYGLPLPALRANSVQTMEMAAAAASLGAEVYVTCWLSPTTSPGEVFAHYGLPPTFQLLPTSAYRRPTGLRSATMLGGPLRRFGRRWLCYTRIPSVAALAAWLGIPTVAEVHSLSLHPRQRSFLPLLARAPGLRRVVVISEALRRQVLQREPCLANRSLMVAPDGVNLERFAIGCSQEEARRCLGLPTGVPIVGYIGRLTPGKGVHVLLQAVHDAPFLTCIVGGNPRDPLDLLQEYRRRYASRQVVFAGHQPPAKIPLFLRSFDVAVAPFTPQPISQVTIRGKAAPYEIHDVMSPLKIFEYMAAGVPMVASDLPVLREVLSPDETAVMVPPENPEALRRGIEGLLGDREAAQRIARRAQQAARAYTWRERARRIFDGLLWDTPDAKSPHLR